MAAPTNGTGAPVSYILEDDFADYRALILKRFPRAESCPGKTVLRLSGQPGTGVFFLAEGMVKVCTTNPEGYTRTLGYHRQNTFFGLGGLLRDQPALATAESITPVRIIRMTEDDLLLLNALEPQFLLDLTKFYCTVLRLMCYDAENQSIGSAEVRLANFLCLYLHTPQYRARPEVEMSQEEMASAVNCSRVQAARICADWRRRGIVRTGRRCLTVTDPAALEAISGACGAERRRQGKSE